MAALGAAGGGGSNDDDSSIDEYVTKKDFYEFKEEIRKEVKTINQEVEKISDGKKYQDF
jgi:predicted transcriptional regulator